MHPHRKNAIAGRISLGLLRIYQITLSPAFAAFGVRCRHAPSCSHYAMDAIGQHGLWAGGWMTLARLCRCHPFGTYGDDPVPLLRPKAPAWAPWRYGDWAWRPAARIVPADDAAPRDD